jgi:hypothetical protein
VFTFSSRVHVIYSYNSCDCTIAFGQVSVACSDSGVTYRSHLFDRSNVVADLVRSSNEESGMDCRCNYSSKGTEILGLQLFHGILVGDRYREPMPNHALAGGDCDLSLKIEQAVGAPIGWQQGYCYRFYFFYSKRQAVMCRFFRLNSSTKAVRLSFEEQRGMNELMVPRDHVFTILNATECCPGLDIPLVFACRDEEDL